MLSELLTCTNSILWYWISWLCPHSLSWVGGISFDYCLTVDLFWFLFKKKGKMVFWFLWAVNNFEFYWLAGATNHFRIEIKLLIDWFFWYCQKYDVEVCINLFMVLSLCQQRAAQQMWPWWIYICNWREGGIFISFFIINTQHIRVSCLVYSLFP